MNFLSYALSIAASFSGLFIGFFLIWIAPEEKKPGERHFKMLQYAVLSLISAVLLIYSLDLYSILLAIILVPAALFLKKSVLLKNRFFPNAPFQTSVVAVLLGAAGYFSSKSTDAFLAISVLILFYNMATGSLLTDYNKKKQSILKIIYYNISYLIAAVLLFFIGL